MSGNGRTNLRRRVHRARLSNVPKNHKNFEVSMSATGHPLAQMALNFLLIPMYFVVLFAIKQTSTHASTLSFANGFGPDSFSKTWTNEPSSATQFPYANRKTSQDLRASKLFERAILRQMKQDLGGDQLIAFTTPEFSERAEAVFESLGVVLVFLEPILLNHWKVMVYISRRPPPLLLVITGRISNEISHAKPRPLGQNGQESWYGTGASVGHFYVVKHVELVLPRYVVEFDMPVQPLFNPFNFAPAIDPLAFAPPLPPLVPPHRFGVGKVSAIKRGAAENQDVKGTTGKGKARVKEENPN
ncbi:hypothetical protein B0H14DRAFT_3143148 [Mycena olivaceomarginata]|nr:hypothetical protein B0H14DRAFT_3143148 [Mycena olivaceomarginata]